MVKPFTNYEEWKKACLARGMEVKEPSANTGIAELGEASRGGQDYGHFDDVTNFGVLCDEPREYTKYLQDQL